jgi:hypothetical protein
VRILMNLYFKSERKVPSWKVYISFSFNFILRYKPCFLGGSEENYRTPNLCDPGLDNF